MSEDEIYDLMKEFKYIVPQGSPMSAIGNEFQIQSLSNCFVIDGIYSEKFDSYGGIFLADQEQAQIMKRRGGVGFDISGLRPKGLPTNNAAKTTDGIAVFMERFSNTTREVAQGSRRGALILTIDCIRKSFHKNSNTICGFCCIIGREPLWSQSRNIKPYSTSPFHNLSLFLIC